jgi:hypothetical protein
MGRGMRNAGAENADRARIASKTGECIKDTANVVGVAEIGGLFSIALVERQHTKRMKI